MKRLQAVLRALLFPPVVALFVLPPLCTALLIYSFLFSSPSHPVSILSFVLSAYPLTAVFGTVVALFVLSLAVFIILQTTKKIKALSHSAIQEKNNEG